MEGNYSLKEIQVRFGVPQHVLIHLCEKGVIAPDIADTDGRGRWREFSKRNLFEFAVALELRKYDIPVAKTGAIIRILSSFEKATQKAVKDFKFPDSLSGSPKIKLYLFDGDFLVFCLGQKSFLGFNVSKVLKGDNSRVQPTKLSKLPTEFHSHLEIDLNELAHEVI
ncbi:MAG: hypothetical protein R3A13_01405 [Bdellovibrionota bacterium]